jgi:hypothetical protein
MVANLSKNPVIKTPEKGKGISSENTSIASLSSPSLQLFSKENSDVTELPNSGSKSLKSVQLFGNNEYHQNNQTGSRVLNSSPSFPPVQRKGSTDLSPKTAAAINKTGLPDNVKSGVEQLSGVSLSDVKVHYNSPKPAQLQAHAYAQGTDIHVASGQEKHVPHEAWHVVQQKQGRVQATKQMKGKVPVNDDAGLEKEADVMGAKAVQMKVIESDPLIISKSENASKHNTPAQLAPKTGGESEIEEPELDESYYFHGANNPDEEFQYTMESLSPANIKKDLEAKKNKAAADADPEGLFSASEGKRHDMFTKASKVLTGKKDVDEFYKENPSYGILGGGKASQPGIPSGKTKEDESDKAIGRLAPMYMKQPEAGAMTEAYHVATGEVGAKSAAARIDGKFHNEAGRFGGGFHVASDIPTGAMEIDHHKNDWKKGDAKKAKDEGKSLEEQKAAYNKADEIKPANYLTYQVNLSGGDIVDATGPLTAMVMNRPKEIERAAREDNKDGILYKSSRGSGNALVLYKNYKSILTLQNKEKAQTEPDKFTEEHEMERELMRNASPASKIDTLKDRNPTTKISNKLPTAHSKKNEWED